MERIRPRAITALLLVLAALSSISAGACGGARKPPKRGVIEKNVSSYTFRRYQEVLDVEVWVQDNEASAFAASYVRSEAEKLGRLEEPDVVNALVTRYERHEGVLRALIEFCRRLAQEQGYVVEERKIGGARVFTVSGAGEAWAMWAADRHVVKVGGRGLQAVPEDVVKAYADRYPSRIDSGMLEGPLPEADRPEPRSEDPEEPFDPENPRPDWQEE